MHDPREKIDKTKEHMKGYEVGYRRYVELDSFVLCMHLPRLELHNLSYFKK